MDDLEYKKGKSEIDQWFPNNKFPPKYDEQLGNYNIGYEYDRLVVYSRKK